MSDRRQTWVQLWPIPSPTNGALVEFLHQWLVQNYTVNSATGPDGIFSQEIRN